MAIAAASVRLGVAGQSLELSGAERCSDLPSIAAVC